MLPGNRLLKFKLAEIFKFERFNLMKSFPGLKAAVFVFARSEETHLRMEKEVMSGCERGEAEQQIGQKSPSDCRLQRIRRLAEAETPTEGLQMLRIHGLSVERYRNMYDSVLQPSVLAALSSSKHAEYVSQVLELKQRLWTALSRPRLQETLMEDGRVEVKEIFDLT